jgi:hypothetical protein
LVESTTVQHAPLGVRDNKKADFRHFLNSSKLSIVAAKLAKIAWIMSPYTSNASDSHTVLHPLCLKGDTAAIILDGVKIVQI